MSCLRACLPAAPPQMSAQACARAAAPCRSAWLARPGCQRSRVAALHRRHRLRAEQPTTGGGSAADDNSPQQPQQEQPTGSTGAQQLPAGSLEKLAELADLNQLQTALNTAIAAEDWSLAAKLRDLLRLLTGAGGGGEGKPQALPSDWHGLGITGWLADRAERLGFNFPTGGCRAGAE